MSKGPSSGDVPSCALNTDLEKVFSNARGLWGALEDIQVSISGKALLNRTFPTRTWEGAVGADTTCDCLGAQPGWCGGANLAPCPAGAAPCPGIPGGKGSGLSPCPDTSGPLMSSSSQTQGVTGQGYVGSSSPLPKDAQVQAGE